MKPILTLVICSILLASCKKEVDSGNANGYLQIVMSALRDSLNYQDYTSLDFSKALLNRVDSASLFYLRVPFKGKTLAGDFVIVRTTQDGRVEQGKIVHIEGKVTGSSFDGNISISSLNRLKSKFSLIENGHIKVNHQRPAARGQVYPEDELPVVVVVAYVNKYDYTYDFGMDLSTLYLLSAYFGSSVSGPVSSAYYGTTDYGGYDYTAGSGYADNNYVGVYSDPTVIIEIDKQANQLPIDIEQYLKCFDIIPDAGAKCEVGIYADIPVDSDPNKIFDFNSGSPGHTFIQIKKVSADGSKSIVQNIGLYPRTGWKASISNAPVDSKIVDNGSHEFNAGYTKSLTPDEFKSTLNEIRYLKNVQYDIDNFNCTDWALAIFNKRGYGLNIPLYHIPGNLPGTGTSMPQGIYNKLMEMKESDVMTADKIQIGFLKGYVTSSDGPCN